MNDDLGAVPLTAGELVYVWEPPPPGLAARLRAGGFTLAPVVWSDDFFALTLADGAPLHLTAAGAAALADCWLLAPAGQSDQGGVMTYARLYGLRLAFWGTAQAPFADSIGLTAGDDDWAGAAALLLRRPPRLRRLLLWDGGGAMAATINGLAAGLTRLGVAVIHLAGGRDWPADAADRETGDAAGCDWLLAADCFDDPAHNPQMVIAAAQARGLKAAFICHGDGLTETAAATDAAALRRRVATALEMAAADALLPVSTDALAQLQTFYRRFLPRLVNLSWRLDACPAPDASHPFAGDGWTAYARQAAMALWARGGATPVLSPPAALEDETARPLLSLCVTTYNRAAWLEVSLRRVLRLTEAYADLVEVAVCDNASTDGTPAVIARLAAAAPRLKTYRNAANVGMLGNLGVSARHARGRFVWLLGDDDLLVEGVVEDVLEGLIRHPDIHMVYLNYAVTRFDAPKDAGEETAQIRAAVPAADGGANRYAARLRDVAAITHNLFTAIYVCVLRRDHALLAYGMNTAGPPFASLESSAPSAAYIVRMLLAAPAYWVGRPGLVVNMNVSWQEHGVLWVLERMPELCDLAERMGVDPAQLDACRDDLCRAAAMNVQRIYQSDNGRIRGSFLLARLLERCKHLDDFRRYQVPLLLDVHRQARQAGKIAGDPPSEELFGRFGLLVN